MKIKDSFNEDDLIWKKRGMPDQIDTDENILLVVREDLIIIGFKIAVYLVGFLLLLLCRILIASFVDSGSGIILLYDVILYTALSVMIVVFAYTFHNYYLSLQIVTTKRMIDVDQTGLFKREVNELAVEQIEDVTYKQNGFFGTVFGFGTVSVQTSADVSTESGGNRGLTGGFVFENVPKPQKIHTIISNLFHLQGESDAIEKAKLNAEYLYKKFNTKPESNTEAPLEKINQSSQPKPSPSFKERLSEMREDNIKR